MGTILYHGTSNLDIIDKIDLTRARDGFANSEYGVGFYTSLNRADGESNAGLRSGGSGWVYELRIPESFDTYSRGHSARWIATFEDVDRPLLDKVTGAMKEMGGPFAARAEELSKRFDEGKLSWTGRDLIKNLQREFGVPKEGRTGPTSADIFIKAGIDGARANGGQYLVFLNPKTLPKPIPYSFNSADNPAAHAAGQFLGALSGMGEADEYNRGGLKASHARELRLALADAVVSAQNHDPAAYEKITLVGHALMNAGVELPGYVKGAFGRAEQETAALAGISPDDVTRRHAAEEIVRQRPPREQGEGFIDYRDRLYAWHGAAHPQANNAEQEAFTTALFGALYRDAQKIFSARTGDALAIDNDPLKLERVLLRETPSRDMPAIQHIEYDLGTLQGEKRSPRGLSPQIVKA